MTVLNVCIGSVIISCDAFLAFSRHKTFILQEKVYVPYITVLTFIFWIGLEFLVQGKTSNLLNKTDIVVVQVVCVVSLAFGYALARLSNRKSKIDFSSKGEAC